MADYFEDDIENSFYAPDDDSDEDFYEPSKAKAKKVRLHTVRLTEARTGLTRLERNLNCTQGNPVGHGAQVQGPPSPQGSQGAGSAQDHQA